MFGKEKPGKPVKLYGITIGHEGKPTTQPRNAITMSDADRNAWANGETMQCFQDETRPNRCTRDAESGSLYCKKHKR